MKRTTYIIIGVLFAGLLAVGSITFYMVSHSRKSGNIVEITGEQKKIQLSDCKTIQFIIKKNQSNHRKHFYFANVPLIIEPADSLAGSLTYADGWEPHLKISSEADTLKVIFDFSEETLNGKYQNMRMVNLSSSALRLKLPQTIQNVYSDLPGVMTIFKGLQRDSFTFDISGITKVENCRFTSLNAQAYNLHLNSGEVRDLYLNLYNDSEWKVNTDSFKIDTEYLMGKRGHHCTLQKNECRQVIWKPLADDATLKLKISQPAKIELGD